MPFFFLVDGTWGDQVCSRMMQGRILIGCTRWHALDWKNVCTRPPREIDFHDVVYIPEGNPFKIWYSGTRMMDTTTDTIDNAPGLVPPETLNHTCCV